MEEICEGSQEEKKMLYIIAKKSGSRREIKKAKKIRENASKKDCHSSRNYSSEDSDSLLDSDIS